MDSAGASVVLGYMSGRADFGGGMLTSAGSTDVYMVKYAANGSYLWSQRFGGTGTERPKGIAVDAANNIVITGYFGGTVEFRWRIPGGLIGQRFPGKVFALRCPPLVPSTDHGLE